MIMKECRFSYSNLDDSLIVSWIEENENVRERFNLGNFIFGLTRAGKIVGIQVLNVSEVLTDYNILKSSLEDLKKINIIIDKKEGCLNIALKLFFKNQEAKIPIPLMNLNPAVAR